MSSAQYKEDIYTSHGAFPVLASTLLPPLHQVGPFSRQGGKKTTTDSTEWSLEPSLHHPFSHFSRYDSKTQNRDSKQLLRCGTTIGLSYLREWDSSNTDQNQDSLGDLSRALLAYFLRNLCAHNTQTTGEDGEEQPAGKKRISSRVFIIHPIQSTTFAPETLFSSLMNSENRQGDTTTISQTQAINLLDQVELLPVHDFSSAAQAISQVSDAVSKIHQQYRAQKHKVSTDTDDENDEEKAYDYYPPTTLFIIEGLDTMTENVVHKSNALRGSAVLTPVLRTLTHMSRTYASFLSILLVNTTALGPLPTAQSQQSRSIQEMRSSTQARSLHEEGGRNATAIGGPGLSGGLYSVFTRQRITSHHQHQGHAGETENDDNRQSEALPLLNTLLSRTLDQGLDTQLLLQRRKGQTLVEVIKDRLGDGLGRWCEWG